MTNKQLIEILSTFPEDMEVFIRIDDGEDGFTDIDCINEVVIGDETGEPTDEKGIEIVTIY